MFLRVRFRKVDGKKALSGGVGFGRGGGRGGRVIRLGAGEKGEGGVRGKIYDLCSTSWFD